MNISGPLIDHVVANLAKEIPKVLLGDVPGTESLGWLWQVVGATCCWAMSDVICDACILPMAPSVAEDEAVAEPPSKADAKPPPRATHHPRGSHQPPTPTSAARTTPRARQRAGSLLERRKAVAEQQATATKEAEGAGKAKDIVPAPESCGRLTPEQNALVSGCVSILTVTIAMCVLGLGGASFSDVTQRGGLDGGFKDMSRLAGAAVGGCVHFGAYFLTLCAFSSASSTVITPLMQLSAVWMLPFSTLAAAMGFATFIRPVHLFSVLLICTGGFLPAAGGCLSHIATMAFWKQRAVRLVIWGELLVCLYNVILHQATFTGHGDALNDAHGADAGAAAGASSTIRFFLVSRAANGLTCAALFSCVPSLRRHAMTLRNVSPGYIMVAFVGECLSMVGVCLVTFSYSSFYEPSVVNAAEGGLQQLFNLLFALTSRHLLGWGREVEQLRVKCISFALVAVGLMMSTL